ncbi:hypothetical protein ACQ4PT_044669 [Festuca glaucescens]
MTRRIRRRRGTSPAAPESLPFNDDMLLEILLRLPPQPSSLPRASAVCKRWRGLVTDPRFLRSFRANHRKPPLLGIFESFNMMLDANGIARYRSYDHNYKRLHLNLAFRPILDPPDRVPCQRFDLRRHDIKIGKFRPNRLLGCRHGRALLMDHMRNEVIVCDPITGHGHRIKAPPELYNAYGAVLCAATDQGHVHGSCHSCPFKVVLMSLWGDEGADEDEEGNRPIVRVYSSETGVWGNAILTTTRCELCNCNPGILVGNVIYWSSKSVGSAISFFNLDGFTDDIIEFDLDKQSLALSKGPPDLDGSSRHQIIHAEDGAVGLAILSHGRFEMWQRKVSCHGGDTWLLQKTIEVHTILGLAPQIEGSMRVMEILGYDEDNGTIFVYVDTSVYIVQLMSMQFKKLYESNHAYSCHPFTSFYAPGDCSALVFVLR